MNYSELCRYFEEKPQVTVSYPFGKDVRVYKVGNKMFGLISENDDPLRINLKCDPDEAAALRDIFSGVIPGYHMNKRLWNTVIMESDVPDGEIQRMIDNSYTLIVSRLTQKVKNALNL